MKLSTLGPAFLSGAVTDGVPAAPPNPAWHLGLPLKNGRVGVNGHGLVRCSVEHKLGAICLTCKGARMELCGGRGGGGGGGAVPALPAGSLAATVAAARMALASRHATVKGTQSKK